MCFDMAEGARYATDQGGDRFNITDAQDAWVTAEANLMSAQAALRRAEAAYEQANVGLRAEGIANDDPVLLARLSDVAVTRSGLDDDDPEVVARRRAATGLFQIEEAVANGMDRGAAVLAVVAGLDPRTV